MLALSLQGCLNVLAELGFPGSKKPEPKLSSALDAGPAALQRKTNNCLLSGSINLPVVAEFENQFTVK